MSATPPGDRVTLKDMHESMRFAVMSRAEHLRLDGRPSTALTVADEVVVHPDTWRHLATAAGAGDDVVLDDGPVVRRTLNDVPVRIDEHVLYGRFLWTWHRQGASA